MTDNPTILLVEGDVLVRHPLAEYLRGCGFKVYEALNVIEARLILSQPGFKIDIVLADVQTSGSSFELRQWCKEQKLAVEVILAGSIEKAVNKAGDLCNEGPAVAKPYQHHIVLDAIKRALARRGKQDK